MRLISVLNWTRNLLLRLRNAREEQRPAAMVPDPRQVLSPRRVGEGSPPTSGVLLSGRYRLDELVGRGTTSYVYRATDFVLAEEVAIKVLVRRGADRSQGPADESAAEAAAAMRLSHPNIARVFHLDRHEHWPYLVMEYLPGLDLHRHVKRTATQRLPLVEILRIGTSCLDALSYAHGCGVMHNDVKPSNLILTNTQTLKLCDFGLARLADESPGAWLAANSAGAPAFMSPERIQGDKSSPQSDLYSVAATLYALTVGRTLFGTEMAQAWRGHLELDVPPSVYLPDPLFEVLRTALAKDPARRFSSAAHMHAALVEAFGDIPDDSGEMKW